MRRHAITAVAGLLLGAAAGSLTRTADAAETSPARLLLITNTQGYRHESIPLLVALVDRLGHESGLWAVERADSDDEVQTLTTAANLKRFDGIAFLNSSEDVPLADRAALLAWVDAGGGVVGVHGAANTLQSWPEFVALLGGEFDYHRDQATVKVRVDDPDHPATAGLESGFELHDEIYLYKSFHRDRVHVLLSTDRHPNTGEPGFYPLAWTREQGRGRVFYTGPGHRDDVVQSAWFARHLLGGIRWTLRR
jgi:type 1 glutamine amidotransferase